MLLAVLTVLPMAALMVHIGQMLADSAEAQARQHLSNLARFAAQDVAEHLNKLRIRTSIVARFTELQSPRPAACQTLIDQLMKDAPDLDGILVARADGSVACSYQPADRFNMADRPWFGAALAAGEPVLASEPLVSRISGKWIAVIAHAVRDPSGKVQAVLALAIDLARFSPIGTFRLGDSGIAVIVTDAGRIVYRNHQAERFIGQFIPHVDLHKQFVAAGGGLATNRGMDGVERIHALAPVPGAEWSVVVGLPTTEVLAPARRLLSHLLLLGLMSAAAMLALAWFAGRRIERPARAMAAAAQVIDGATQGVRIPVAGPQELQTVAQEFNNVLERLGVVLDEACRLNAELERRVVERTAELQTANEEMRGFAYTVSHDLRAPLRAILGFGSELRDQASDRLNEEERHFLDRILAGAARMNELIDGILSLSRLAQADLETAPVDLSALADDIALQLAQRHPALAVAFSAQAGLRAQGDPRLLRAVMENLLGNAWKYTARRGDARVEFGALAEATDGKRVFFVRDNGTGFDMAFADKLFLPFQRLHAGSEFEGVGLGLAGVRRIVQRHGGRIWAEAKPGEGATFFFELPTA